MADDNYAVQLSLNLPPIGQYAKGHMLNIRADSSGELGDKVNDLRALGKTDSLIGSFFPSPPAEQTTEQAVQTVQQQMPQAEQVPPPGQWPTPQGGTQPPQGPPQQPPQAPPAQAQPTGAPCEKCGTPKVWKLRRDRTNGWWACPNERKQANGSWSCQ